MHKFLGIGRDCSIWSGAHIVGAEYIRVGNAVTIDDYCFIYARAYITLGDFVHICAFSSITGGEACEVGPFSSLSWGARVFTGTENLKKLLGPKIPLDLREAVRKPVTIGKHVLIGANSVILPGAHIHDGAIIGASSVVRQDQEIAPWTVWGGVPAHYIYARDRQLILAAEEQLRKRYYHNGVYIGAV